MKRLTSLCKKLQCSSVIRTLPFLLTVSCTLRDESLPKTHKVGLGLNSGFSFLTPLHKLDEAAEEASCSSLQTFLHTPLGNFAVAVHPLPDKKKTILQIEADTFEILDQKPPSQLCKNDPNTYKYVATLIERNVPACRVSIKDSTLSCTIPYESAEDSLDELKEIKLSLLRQVKRVPYLLSRRLTLAENLASLLTSRHWEEGLQAFCGVMNASLPSERPLIVTSKLWREALCTQDVGTQKYEVALMVLTKAVEEIAFMHLLQDEANLAGNLSVHVQAAMLPPSKKVWVKLEPATDTVDNLKLAIEKARFTSLNPDVPVKKVKKRKGSRKHLLEPSEEVLAQTPKPANTVPKACWFPGFSGKEAEFEWGRFLGMWGNNVDAACPQVESKVEFSSIARYFIDTISAETSFELMESNDKPLSLPAGSYLYTVYEIPERLGDKLESHLVDQGTVVWNGSKQGLTIATKEH